MKNRYLYKTIIAILTLSIMNSCDDFLDVNDDVNNPTTGQPSLLLTSAQASVVSAVGFSGLGRQVGVFMHQVVRRGEGDQYVTNGSDFGISTAWGSFYDQALQDLEIIIVDETTNDNRIYVGVAKMLKAYSYSVMVDVWGDVPFSEALRASEIRFPAYDDGATVYVATLTMIDEAIADLSATDAANILVPGADDLFYGGNTTNWIKFGNTLKLKMLNQLRDVSTVSDRDAQIVQLINDNNLINSPADDFKFVYGTSVTPENRHPLFVSEYTQASPGFYISPWVYEMMHGLSPNILAGVVDPRIPYYYTRQLLPGAAAENPFEYLQADGFLSIHFGSIHPNQASGQQSSQTVLGLYPCNGFYDDASGTKVAATTGNGAAPERILTYFKRLYIEAELALDGTISGDARALLTSAIQASFDEVNSAVGSNGQAGVPVIPAATIPMIPFSNDDPDSILAVPGYDDFYIPAVLAEYDGGNDAKKLEVILTQKWLASFGNAVDAYSDYRRTGFPLLFDPNNYNGADPATYQATTTAGRAYPVSLPWEQNDLDINPNAPAQKNPTSDKVFWDAN